MSDESIPTEHDTHRTPRWWRRRRTVLVGGGAGVAVAIALSIGIPLTATASTTTTTGAAAQSPTTPSTWSRGPGSGYGSSGYGSGGSGYGGSGYGSTSTAESTNAAATTASTTQSTGVVLIDTVLGYQQSAAAGTGMVLTSDGFVLTNNHVIDGATTITVTIAATGQTYTARLVGTDTADDVALLQLEGASGLQTVTIDANASAQVGADITAVGNAEGGGVLMAATGTITALESTVTTAAEATVSGETLNGMIKIAADVVSGDSGGALLDAEGEVIGMNTAASSGSTTVTAYAIPIDDALAIVKQIRAGDTSDGVTIGYPALLGVAVTSPLTSTTLGFGAQEYARYGASGRTVTTAGATISGIYASTPAAQAGLTAGDVITAVDGRTITDSAALTTTLAAKAPGDTVTITWTDTSGASHSVAVTLAEGPA